MSDSRRRSNKVRRKVFPTTAISRLAGRVGRIRIPAWLRKPLWRAVGWQMGMQLSQAARDITLYETWDSLFTRRLLSGLRTFDRRQGVLGSPSDGRLTQLNDAFTEVTIKGQNERIAGWLGREKLPWAQPQVAVIYLSPKDYHRVHFPVGGKLLGFTYIPGRLLPVQPSLARHFDDVFAQNERVTVWIQSKYGPVSVTMVGALCVGGISLSFDELTTNQRAKRNRLDRSLEERDLQVEVGDELGVFHLGSSVLLVWEGSGFVRDSEIREGTSVVVGRAIGRWHAPNLVTNPPTE